MRAEPHVEPARGRCNDTPRRYHAVVRLQSRHRNQGGRPRSDSYVVVCDCKRLGNSATNRGNAAVFRGDSTDCRTWENVPRRDAVTSDVSIGTLADAQWRRHTVALVNGGCIEGRRCGDLAGEQLTIGF